MAIPNPSHFELQSILRLSMSPIFKISGRDLVKGLVVAILAGILSAVQQVVQANGLSFDKLSLMNVLGAAVISGIAYLSKQLITDEDGRIGGTI